MKKNCFNLESSCMDGYCSADREDIPERGKREVRVSTMREEGKIEIYFLF